MPKINYTTWNCIDTVEYHGFKIELLNVHITNRNNLEFLQMNYSNDRQ